MKNVTFSDRNMTVARDYPAILMIFSFFPCTYLYGLQILQHARYFTIWTHFMLG